MNDKFVFKKIFNDYELIVTEKGFYLRDIKSDNVILDASDMDAHWIVELMGNLSNREFYINYNGHGDGFSFGISRRKE